jgi:HlyD family secretion protein
MTPSVAAQDLSQLRLVVAMSNTSQQNEAHMKGTRYWFAAGALAVTITAGTLYYRDDVAANAPPVTTVEATRGDVVATVEASGTLEAVTTVEVGTQVSGAIKALKADFNSHVHKGEVIAELDPSLFETQVAQEKATVERLKSEAERARVQADDAKVKLGRARELSERQLIAKSDLDAAESTANAAQAAVKSADAQVTQATASLNQAQVNLSHTIIRAPIDGVVIARNVDVGQTVAASMQAPTLFILAQDLREMRVNAKIDESDIGKIQAKQPVHFRVDAYPNDTFEGTISQVRLQPVVEQNVVTYVTVIDVPNPDLKLKPGMTRAVTVEIARADDVVRVPNAALRFQPDNDVFAKLGQPVPEHSRGRRGVWVLEGGRLTRVPVELGVTDGTQTAVTSGLTAGTHVATNLAASSTTSQSPSAPRSPLLPAGRRGGGGGGGRS